MKDENIKQLIYDIQREKDSQKQIELVKTFDARSVSPSSLSQREETDYVIQDKTKIVPTNPVAQINELSSECNAPVNPIWHSHKFAIGTKIQFPTFEKLRLEGWVDNGEYIAHPKYKTVFLSYEQIADFEDTEVTISSQNEPGQYSIEEEDYYDDWPFDLMNVVSVKKPEKLNFDDQSLQEQAFHILHYLENKPTQMIIPDGRVRLLKETLGDYKPYDEVCYLPVIKNIQVRTN